MYLLFFIVFFLLIGVFFVARILNIFGNIFSTGNRKPRNNNSSDTRSQSTDAGSQPVKKVFSDNEGEYVDFEEVKEEKIEKPDDSSSE